MQVHQTVIPALFKREYNALKAMRQEQTPDATGRLKKNKSS